jgi:hypothetical protein
MRTRTAASQLEHDSAESLLRAAQDLGLQARIQPRGTTHQADLQLTSPRGASVRVEVKGMALASAERVRELSRRTRAGVSIVVVADQIPAAIREQLNGAGIGWFDRRGHLRLVADGVFIDADVAPQTRRAEKGGDTLRPINGRSGLAAAAALLLRPDDPLRVSEVARIAGLNPSSITRALTSIVDAHLAERRGRGEYRPLTPELFWALADVWPRESVTIRWDGPPDVTELLSAHPDVSQPGWAEAVLRGAIAWGAPLVATADYPRHWYVPTEREIRRLAVLHENGAGDAWQLSTDPIGLVAATRPGLLPADWFVAHPLFCALDLTASARDREALEEWTPPDGFTRVW